MSEHADLRCLIACVKAAYDDDGLAQLRSITSPSSINQLPAQSRRHRVEGLCWEGLVRASIDLPTEVADDLRRGAAEVASHSLRITARCGEIARRFLDQKVPILFLKGVALAALAYPRPQLKNSTDIDILIDPANLDAAAAILETLGFRLSQPASQKALAPWHRRRKESVWVDLGQHLQLDLHTALADNPRNLDGIGLSSPLQRVELPGGRALATLADPLLYAYLCVHGASSAWFRLKWLADLDAFLLGRSAETVAAFHATAIAAGAGRASSVALSLLDRHFDRPIPIEYRRAWPVGWATRISDQQLRYAKEPTDRLGGTVGIRLTQALIQSSALRMAAEIARQSHEIGSRLIVR